jgi:ABC-2 type transport system ATP-binding protein
VDGTQVTIAVDEVVPALHALTSWAVEQGIDLPDLTVDRPSLEDVYLELTGAADPADDTADGPTDAAGEEPT